jgi:RimJ/RimL family protein N-acetyltransferase
LKILPVTLEGSFVRLEPLTHTHAVDLFEAAQNNEVWRYLPAPRPTRLEEINNLIESAFALKVGGTQMPFAIVDRASNRAIGSTRYLDIQPANRNLEIGWTWLGRDYWRSPRNTECKYLLLQHAFETQQAIRVCLKTDKRNLISQAAIERIGGVKEGILRNHMILHDGYIRDSVYYSILDSEWGAVKATLETFLKR